MPLRSRLLVVMPSAAADPMVLWRWYAHLRLLVVVPVALVHDFAWRSLSRITAEGLLLREVHVALIHVLLLVLGRVPLPGEVGASALLHWVATWVCFWVVVKARSLHVTLAVRFAVRMHLASELRGREVLLVGSVLLEVLEGGWVGLLVVLVASAVMSRVRPSAIVVAITVEGGLA